MPQINIIRIMKKSIFLLAGVVFAAVGLLFSGCNSPENKQPKKTKEVFRPDRDMCVKYTEDALMRLGTCTDEKVFVYSIAKIDDAIRSATTAKRYCSDDGLVRRFDVALKRMYDARMILVHASEDFRGVPRLSIGDENGDIDVDVLVSLDNYYKEEAQYPVSPKEVLFVYESYPEMMPLVEKAIDDLYFIRDRL